MSQPPLACYQLEGRGRAALYTKITGCCACVHAGEAKKSLGGQTDWHFSRLFQCQLLMFTFKDFAGPEV